MHFPITEQIQCMDITMLYSFIVTLADKLIWQTWRKLLTDKDQCHAARHFLL